MLAYDTHTYQKVSQCCNFSVTPTSEDEFERINKNDSFSIVINLPYICNKCHKYCSVKRI